MNTSRSRRSVYATYKAGRLGSGQGIDFEIAGDLTVYHCFQSINVAR